MTFNHIIENIDLWIWDFDDTLIDTDTYYSKSMSVGDILSRSNRDLEQEFPNMAFFKLFVKQLLQANKKVAIASFGTYRIIQAYMDRVFGRGQRIFTKRNILTILRDEKTNKVLEFPNDKNYMIRRLMKIMNIAEKEGEVLRLDGSLMFTRQNFILLKEKVLNHFINHDLLSISKFKELANTSRKFAVPLLEFFDKEKITYRDGNSRRLIK